MNYRQESEEIAEVLMAAVRSRIPSPVQYRPENPGGSPLPHSLIGWLMSRVVDSVVLVESGARLNIQNLIFISIFLSSKF